MNKNISLLLLVHNEIDTIENEIVQINKFLSNNSNSELVIVILELMVLIFQVLD